MSAFKIEFLLFVNIQDVL